MLLPLKTSLPTHFNFQASLRLRRVERKEMKISSLSFSNTPDRSISPSASPCPFPFPFPFPKASVGRKCYSVSPLARHFPQDPHSVAAAGSRARSPPPSPSEPHRQLRFISRLLSPPMLARGLLGTLVGSTVAEREQTLPSLPLLYPLAPSLCAASRHFQQSEHQ